MNMPYPIHYLRRQEIDTAKWDACIETAPNGLIYGRSFYLDLMTAGQWDALVLEDYAAVMPLPWNRKFGFHYLYQPFCTPCLGIYGTPPPDPPGFPPNMPASSHLISAIPFLQAIPRKFKYWDIDLNETNLAGESTGRAALPGRPVVCTLRINHLLRLDKPGETLEREYHRLARRMAARAVQNHLVVTRQTPPADIIRQYRKEYGDRHSRIRPAAYERLIACATAARENGNAQTYLASWPDGEIAAFYLVLSDKKFVYSIIGGSTRKGRAAGAFYRLTDTAIKDHAGTDRVFRFEGSDIPGIASFDASFGSVPLRYPHLVMNDLPFPFRLFK